MAWIVRAQWQAANGTIKTWTRRFRSKPAIQLFPNGDGTCSANASEEDESYAKSLSRVDWIERELVEEA